MLYMHVGDRSALKARPFDRRIAGKIPLSSHDFGRTSMPRDNPDLGSQSRTGGSPWEQFRPSRWSSFSIAFTALLAAASLAGAIGAAIAGDFATCAFLLGAGVFLAHLAGLSIAMRRYPRGTTKPRLATIDDGSTGLTFTYRISLYYWSAAFLILTTLGLILVALAFLADALVVAIVVLLMAAVPAATVYMLLRRAPGQLTLTPDGMYHRGFTFTYFAPWYAVLKVDAAEHLRAPLIAVTAAPTKDTRTQRSTPRAFAGWEQRLFPIMAIQAPWLNSDPAIVYQALCHYQDNPEHRAELSSPAAIDRVRRLLPR